MNPTPLEPSSERSSEGLLRAFEKVNEGINWIPVSPGGKSDEVRIALIAFSSSTYKELEALAGGGSIADALRDAIDISKWFNEALKEGAKIYVKRKGKLHEVVKK